METKLKVPALGRASAILSFLSEREADFPAIVAGVGLPKSTTYLLLQSLEELGWVRRLPGKQGYALGFRLFELGNLAVAKINIRDQAMGLLQELCDEQVLTCHLGYLDGNHGVYLAKIDPESTMLINSWEGKRVALKSSAMGKVFLAWRGADERTALIAARPFIEKTPQTITDPAAFLAHVGKVRGQGYAIDDEEDVTGIRCVAAPVFNPHGEVNYAVSVSGPIQDVTKARLPSLTDAVKKTAARLTTAIGGMRQG